MAAFDQALAGPVPVSLAGITPQDIHPRFPALSRNLRIPRYGCYGGIGAAQGLRRSRFGDLPHNTTALKVGFEAIRAGGTRAHRITSASREKISKQHDKFRFSPPALETPAAFLGIQHKRKRQSRSRRSRVRGSLFVFGFLFQG
jgi:hypothetical protein